MKKIISLLLAMALLFTLAVSAAETPPTAEGSAEHIFCRLAYIHEKALTYLEEIKRAWDLVIENYTYEMYSSKTVYSDWYCRYFLLPDFDHYMDFYMYFTNHYGVDWNDKSRYSSFQEQSYYFVFKPMLDYYRGDVRQTAWMIAHMIYGNEHLAEYMDSVKADLKALMAGSPDYPYLSKLQDFYQETYELVDSIVNMSFDYDSLSAAVTRHRSKQSSTKAAFSLIFDWVPETGPDWSFTVSVSPVFRDLFDAAQGK